MPFLRSRKNKEAQKAGTWCPGGLASAGAARPGSTQQMQPCGTFRAPVRSSDLTVQLVRCSGLSVPRCKAGVDWSGVPKACSTESSPWGCLSIRRSLKPEVSWSGKAEEPGMCQPLWPVYNASENNGDREVP